PRTLSWLMWNFSGSRSGGRGGAHWRADNRSATMQNGSTTAAMCRRSLGISRSPSMMMIAAQTSSSGTNEPRLSFSVSNCWSSSEKNIPHRFYKFRLQFSAFRPGAESANPQADLAASGQRRQVVDQRRHAWLHPRHQHPPGEDAERNRQHDQRGDRDDL